MSSRCYILFAAVGAALVLGGAAVLAQAPPGQDGSNQAPPVEQAKQASPTPSPADNSATPNPGVSQKRDPFWPVGYVPRPVPVIQPEKKTAPTHAVVLPPAGQDWAHALEQVRIQGIVGGRNGKFFATVNGRVVESGDEIAVTFEGSTYRWKIRAISAKGIATEPLSVRAER
jgi:hypothetical protein